MIESRRIPIAWGVAVKTRPARDARHARHQRQQCSIGGAVEVIMPNMPFTVSVS
jgi:hypothetical protein